MEKHQEINKIEITSRLALEWTNNFPISDTNKTLNSSQVASLTQYTKNGSMEFLVKEINLVWIICESRIEVINFHDQVAIDVYFIFVNLGHTVDVRLIDAPNSSWWGHLWEANSFASWWWYIHRIQPMVLLLNTTIRYASLSRRANNLTSVKDFSKTSKSKL